MSPSEEEPGQSSEFITRQAFLATRQDRTNDIFGFYSWKKPATLLWGSFILNSRARVSLLLSSFLLKMWPNCYWASGVNTSLLLRAEWGGRLALVVLFQRPQRKLISFQLYSCHLGEWTFLLLIRNKWKGKIKAKVIRISSSMLGTRRNKPQNRGSNCPNKSALESPYGLTCGYPLGSSSFSPLVS